MRLGANLELFSRLWRDATTVLGADERVPKLVASRTLTDASRGELPVLPGTIAERRQARAAHVIITGSLSVVHG